jgi:hypothetical protein
VSVLAHVKTGNFHLDPSRFDDYAVIGATFSDMFQRISSKRVSALGCPAIDQPWLGCSYSPYLNSAPSPARDRTMPDITIRDPGVMLRTINRTIDRIQLSP